MPRYGIGAAVHGGSNPATPPTNPGNGSGGAGVLGAMRTGGGFTAVASAAKSDISDVTTGRITLGMIELTLVGLIAFYVWTRSAQGG